jgi:predicted NAD-dependent protein-ADP-ribosyltransferase YbiA (DUF1768 family)
MNHLFYTKAEILKIKYIQCADFREKLTNSKGYLAHNVKCSFWGTGPDGKGQNVFGPCFVNFNLQ